MPLFVLDTSIWIRVGRHHPPDIFRSLWEQLDSSVAAEEIRSPEEVKYELERGTDNLAEVLSQRRGLFVPLDDPVQVSVSDVMAACPDLADPNSERNRADPFVVALAKVRSGTVVTGEHPRRAPTAPPKIPGACSQLGIDWLDWFSFLRAIGWRL